MKFVLVNGRTPRPHLSVRCAVSQTGRATCENLQRGSPTAITSATPVTASFASQRSKSMQGRHDIHRRFEVPAANGSRPIAGGRLCGGKVSELFRTANGFAVEAIVAEKCSIVFFCSAGCYLNEIPSGCLARA